jgi:hypothetical protein
MHLKEQPRSGDKSLVGNKGYRRYLKVEGSGHFVIDEKQAHLPQVQRNDSRPIRGHVFCSFLALLLKTELERRMKYADLQCEWAQVLRGLETLQQVEATFQDIATGARFNPP